MNIVLFTHPPFLASQSMPRYANMLFQGLHNRGNKVEVWTTSPWFYCLPGNKSLKKWLGYIDQYIVFPGYVRKQLRKCPKDTLFVFTDHALGPWVPLVCNRPHVIHCHDFNAQRSALGFEDKNPTSWTGKRYQSFIRKGYSQGKNFISVSEKTKTDLHEFLQRKPAFSEVVYNGLNHPFQILDPENSRSLISKKIGVNVDGGYILHVGGNQWYKNREGVIGIYNAWRSSGQNTAPLLLIGENPTDSLQKLRNRSTYKNDIYFVNGLSNDEVNSAYSGALVFLFPSLAEGFGWPIAEAMACGCPVITTGEAPMTEVGGNAAWYVPKMPGSEIELETWVKLVAERMDKLLAIPDGERINLVNVGLENAQRFDQKKVLDDLIRMYEQVLLQ